MDDGAERFAGEDGLRRLRDLIRRQPFVEGNVDLAAALAEVAEIVSYAPGEPVITQGATDCDLVLILSGETTLTLNGREDVVRKAGTHVGEMALIDPSAPRSATVRATAPTVVGRIPESNFVRIADGFPFIWRNLARVLGDRLRDRAGKVVARKATARIFLASSSEGRAAAEMLQELSCSEPFEVVVWWDGIFTPGFTNIEALEAELLRADFALLFLSPDDKVRVRGSTGVAPRDNVILELGLFAGALGRRRALMVAPRRPRLKLPTDILGVVPILYDETLFLKDAMQEVLVALRRLVHELGAK